MAAMPGLAVAAARCRRRPRRRVCGAGQACSLLFLLVLPCLLSDNGAHARPFGNAAAGMMLEQAHAAIDATESTLADVLRSLPSGADAEAHVLLELYASWCPHCRHYAPQYDEIARAINGSPQTQTRRAHVLRMDCATNDALCMKFDIRGYPSIVWGTASAVERVRSGASAFKDEADHLTHISERKPAQVLKFVNGKLGTAFGEQGQPPALPSSAGLRRGAPTPPAAAARPVAASTRDAAMATVMLSSLIFGHTPNTAVRLPPLPADQRPPLLAWYGVLARHHPVAACRAGASAVGDAMHAHWPPADDGRPEHFAGISICGADGALQLPKDGTSNFPDDAWQDCRGETRGFTCGLWQLFHAVAADAMVNDAEGDGAALLAALEGYVRHFFGCQVCRDHFLTLTSAPPAARVRTPRDFALWLWRAHNVVNARLAAEEAEGGTGDPAFPKVAWPTEVQCPACHRGAPHEPSADGDADAAWRSAAHTDVAWDDDAVVAYLIRYYAGAARAPPAPRAPPARRPVPAQFTDYEGGAAGRSNLGLSSFALACVALLALLALLACTRGRAPLRARALAKRFSVLPQYQVGLAKAL